MIANYHTHTPRCRHANGTEEEYVRSAINSGLKILGFSDHTPYWFPGEYYSHMRMYPDELQEYCSCIRTLQDKYAGRLQIHLGLEVEYYPAYFQELMSRLRDQGIEYCLLGQHWLGSEIGEPYCGKPTEDERSLQRYCDQVIEAMNTGIFTYLAHPDLIHFVGENRIYQKHMRRLCREANACGVPLEINLMGLTTGRNYPDQRFWQVAGEENCRCVIGCDAHSPGAIANLPAQLQAIELVQKYGLTLLETVELRPIG